MAKITTKKMEAFAKETMDGVRARLEKDSYSNKQRVEFFKLLEGEVGVQLDYLEDEENDLSDVEDDDV